MQITTAERTKQIPEILSQRLPLRAKIATAESNLRSLAHSLENLAANRDRLIIQQRSGTWSGFPTVSSAQVSEPEAQNLQQLNFHRLQTQIQSQLTGLNLLKSRFNRDTINYWGYWSCGTGKKPFITEFDRTI
ncbi:MAG TPA: hypothetical protein V6C71_01860 [Coleofasciculaceae cyanobacterium]|jgi:hypothetical protein